MQSIDLSYIILTVSRRERFLWLLLLALFSEPSFEFLGDFFLRLRLLQALLSESESLGDLALAGSLILIDILLCFLLYLLRALFSESESLGDFSLSGSYILTDFLLEFLLYLLRALFSESESLGDFSLTGSLILTDFFLDLTLFLLR